MNEINTTVISSVHQNDTVPATENAEVQVEFIEAPCDCFKITSITKRMARVIKTAEYENKQIETVITADVQEGFFEEASKMIEKLLIADIDRQEQEIRANILAIEEEKKSEQIKQAEEVAAKMKKIDIHKWLFSTQYGEQITVSNDMHYQMVCPRCGGKLEKKNGRSGPFYGCSNYHTGNCKFTINHNQVYDFLNRAVEFIETNTVLHPERIYGYITTQGTVEMDTTYAMQEDNPQQQTQQVHQEAKTYPNGLPIPQPIQRPQNNSVNYAEEELPF